MSTFVGLYLLCLAILLPKVLRLPWASARNVLLGMLLGTVAGFVVCIFVLAPFLLAER